MKENGIWIDLRNSEQVKWWNNIARYLVRVVYSNYIIETATNEKVGILIAIAGPFKNYVIKHNARFIDNPVTEVFECK